MVYPYNWLLPGNNKEPQTDTQRTMDGSQKHYAEQSKSETKEKCPIIPLRDTVRQAKLTCSDKKQISVYIHPGEGMGSTDCKEAQEYEWARVIRRRGEGQQPVEARQFLVNTRLFGAAWPRTPLYNK